MQSDYVSRWPGDKVKPFLLLRDVDNDDIPDELHSMWYTFLLQTSCANCADDYSALDALRFGPICKGRYHLVTSFLRFDEYAVVPLAFIKKTGVTLPEGSICIDTFEKAQRWARFSNAVQNKFESAVDVAKQLSIPQPGVTEAVQATLGDMLGYISAMEEQMETTVNPWQPIVFIPLF
ncbi:MAG: hypothetical protein CMP20_09390 [Rickettsiales bacterium]|nr:hypothetical protein [Rickettsiales bacterium]